MNQEHRTESSAPLAIRSVEFEKSATRPSHFAKDELPEIAFVGRSNVGKSSLLNVLVNRKRLARVSATPGHTQLINFFLLNDEARLVDLPGYGFAKAPKSVTKTWGMMVTAYLAQSKNLRGIFALFDIRRQIADDDKLLLDWLRHYQIPFAAVLTKADKLTRGNQAKAKREIERDLEPYNPFAVHLFSAQTRQGRDDLLRTAAALLASNSQSSA